MKNLVVGSLVLMLVILGWGNRSLGEQVPVPRGELRIVDKHPLNWVSITYNVFEHLMEVDKDGTLVPRLATGSKHSANVCRRNGAAPSPRFRPLISRP